MTTVRLYLMTRKTLVQLQRTLNFRRVPIVGEWLRFDRSGLSPHQVTEVTHDEHGNTEVVLGIQKDDSGKILFHPTAEDLQYDIEELCEGGWKVVSSKSNRYWGPKLGKRLRRIVPPDTKRRR